MCVGRCTLNLPASSVDVYLGNVFLSPIPGVLSKGPLDIDIDTDLNEPVNSDDDTGKISLAAVGGAAGVLGGEELRGSLVILPVSSSAPGRLVWLPEVFERGLFVRNNSDCWSVVETSPSLFRFCTLEVMAGVSSISSVPSRGRPLIDISSPEKEIADSKSAVSPDRTDPTVVSLSLSGPTCPAPGSLVNATFIVTVMSKSRVPSGFMGNQSASLIGSV